MLFHKVVVGNQPVSAAVDAGLGQAYVVNTNGGSLSIVDLPTRRVVGTVPLPLLNVPRAIAVDPISHLVYVGSDDLTGGISVVDGVTRVVLDTIAVGDRVTDLGFNLGGPSIPTPFDERRLYALVEAGSSNPEHPTRLQTWDLFPNGGDLVRDYNAPAPDGARYLAAEGLYGYVWVSDGAGTVYKLEPNSGVIRAGPIATGTVCCSSGPSFDIAIDPIHHLVYVTRFAGVVYTNGLLTVIQEDDRYPHDILAELTLGDDPAFIGVDEAQARVYVGNLDSHNVSVVQAAPAVTAANPGGLWNCCGTDPPVVNVTEIGQLVGAVFPGTPVFDPALNLLVVPDQYGSPAGGSLVLFGDPTDDADADGMPDVIDADGGTGTASVGSFLDWTGYNPVAPGGLLPLTTGSVVDTGGLTLTYTDLADPEGVRIAATGSGGPAIIERCGGSRINLPAGGAVTVTCGSVSRRFAATTNADKVDENPGDGACETDVAGECSLRAAVMEANATLGVDTITLPADTYTLTLSGAEPGGPLAASVGDLDVVAGLVIEGKGSATTIIAGDAGWGDRIIHATPDGGNPLPVPLTVSGVTLTGGHTTEDGGALFYSDPSERLVLRDVVVTDSTAAIRGGGAIVDVTNATFDDVSFTHNTATSGGGLDLQGRGGGTIAATNLKLVGNKADSGGGLRFYQGSLAPPTLEVTGLVAEGNTAGDATRSGGGGGILLQGNAVFANVRIVGNTANGPGGGINSISDLTIAGGVISGNVARNNGGGLTLNSPSGGADNVKIRLTDLVIDDNAAERGGAISSQVYNGSEILLERVAITNNRACNAYLPPLSEFTGQCVSETTPTTPAYYNEGTGGADLTLVSNLVAQPPLLTSLDLVNVTFSGNKGGPNRSSNAEALRITNLTGNVGSEAHLTNVTVARNNGGNLPSIFLSGDGPVEFKNTLVAANAGANCNNSGQVIPLGGNLEEASVGSCFGLASVVADAKLGPLTTDGGTKVVPLLAGSPAIDAAASCLPVDQRGKPRPQGAGCDIGAFELLPTSLTLGGTTIFAGFGGGPYGTITSTCLPASGPTGTYTQDSVTPTTVLPDGFGSGTVTTSGSYTLGPLSGGLPTTIPTAPMVSAASGPINISSAAGTATVNVIPTGYPFAVNRCANFTNSDLSGTSYAGYIRDVLHTDPPVVVGGFDMSFGFTGTYEALIIPSGTDSAVIEKGTVRVNAGDTLFRVPAGSGRPGTSFTIEFTPQSREPAPPDADRDGIPDAIDVPGAAFAFSDASPPALTTGNRGVITDKGGLTVTVEDLVPGGVRVTATGNGSGTTTVEQCGLPTATASLNAGETLTVVCGSATLTAGRVAGTGPGDGVITVRSGSTIVSIPTGVTATLDKTSATGPTTVKNVIGGEVSVTTGGTTVKVGANTPATTFPVTTTSLCKLTRDLVQGSAKYATATLKQKAEANALATASCTILAAITPRLTAKQKANLIASYKTSVQTLVQRGWLSQPQADTLKTLATTL